MDGRDGANYRTEVGGNFTSSIIAFFILCLIEKGDV